MDSNCADDKTPCDVPLLIFESELAAIESETLAWPDRETGGELFGYFTYAGWPVVHLVRNANGSALRASATFHPDADQIDREGRDLIDRFGLQHLGQWHSHHRFLLTHPSGQDRKTVTEAIRTYGLRSFVQVIANLRRTNGSDHAMAHSYWYAAEHPGVCDAMPWLVLPGMSPIRASVEAQSPTSSTIHLKPRVTTWDEFRGSASRQPVALSEPPITDEAVISRLSQEFCALHVAGIAAIGRPVNGSLRIDASLHGQQFAVVLGPDFPNSCPTVIRVVHGAPDVEIHLPWKPQHRVAELLTKAAAPKPRGNNGLVAPTTLLRAMRTLRHKRRELGLAVSKGAIFRRRGE